ncbi:MAG: cob(I)yrinic acid a,c-diamide adenosyltransferase [Thermoguttaceae bacterium]|jgi:cob(I)alamin adenosyltransferase
MTDAPRILVFTGDGKGKTTAALGMALRAAGHGMRTCVLQFVKHDAAVGEMAASAGVPLIEIVQVGRGFLPPAGGPDTASHRAAAQEGIRKAAEVLAGGQYPLVILDEVCFAVARGLLDERQVIDAVRQARSGTCVVLTGRDATEGLAGLADTVTEMRCVKHALASGIAAQKGVEW